MPIALTHAGLVAERATQAFWPLWTVLFIGLAPLVFGLHELAPLELVWGFAVIVVCGLVWSLWRGARMFRWPNRAEAIARVDSRLPGRPIATLADTQAIGAGDEASEAVWRAHLRRMEARTSEARAVEPDLRVSRADPFGLRYMALLAFVVALLFGSLWRVGSIADAAPGQGVDIATGPTWEGWVEPPAYTGKPTLYLADVIGQTLRVPQGALVTVRLYGEVGELSLSETVSGRTGELPPATDVQQSFEVTRTGAIEIMGEGGARFDLRLLPDTPPTVELTGPIEADATGEMAQPFAARDDFGVFAGAATITLDLAEVDRRHGLAIDPDPREPLVLDLPMPFSGDRADFEEVLIDDLSEHPLANLPVTMTLTVEDAIGQTGSTEVASFRLPGLRFFQPVARAVIEQRRDLLWSKANAPRVAQILRAVSHRPDDIFPNETLYLRLRGVIRQLESLEEVGLTDEVQEEVSTALWEIALELELGALADARARLERAQERLEEAMRNGASDEEIAELMQELREATNDYLDMLAQQAPEMENGTDQPDRGEGGNNITQDELQALMDRIQELMEEGRMAEAMELMEQLNELMQNLQVTRGEGGEGGRQSPGEQSMQDLAETLRDQQQLNDDSFRELQEEFNQRGQQNGQQQQPGQQGQQGQQPGQQQGQQGQQGQQPGQQQGEGQQGGQQQGQQQGQGQGQGNNNQDGLTGENGQGGEGMSTDPGTLADRQSALRRGLQQLRDALPGLDGEAADRAEGALDRAEGAMEGAEEALRDGDMAEAIDRQSEALDALRDGMRNLGEALAQNQREELQEGQGTQEGQAQARPAPERRDPLGRQMGNAGQLGSDENMLRDEVNRRAEELLKELRDRSAQQDRPQQELDYLRRLLDRF